MIVRGNALNIPLADNSVHCVVTSPPYWGLRKYHGEQEILWEVKDAERSTALSGNDIFVRDSNGNDAYVEGGRVIHQQRNRCAFGLEPTIEKYVEHSILILREVRRVLRDDGVCWLNLGDSYSAGGWECNRRSTIGAGSMAADERKSGKQPQASGLKPLDLCLIPERVALAAQADGWYVRSLVIWNKPNPMPESVNGWRWERHRVKVKSGRYDSSEKQAHTNLGGGFNQRERGEEGWAAQWADCPGCEKCSPNDGLVLRKGSWRPTDAYEHILMLAKSANYFGDAETVREALSPLPENSQSRGPKTTPLERGPRDCGNTGLHGLAMRMREGLVNGRNLRNVWTFPTQPYPEAHFATFPERLPEICIKASTSERGCCPKCKSPLVRIKGSSGWRPSCSCNAGEPVPCTVLDPFGGSGTTARVATELGRSAVSLDLAYHGLASKRTTEIQPWMIFV